MIAPVRYARRHRTTAKRPHHVRHRPNQAPSVTSYCIYMHTALGLMSQSGRRCRSVGSARRDCRTCDHRPPCHIPPQAPSTPGAQFDPRLRLALRCRCMIVVLVPWWWVVGGCSDAAPTNTTMGDQRSGPQAQRVVNAHIQANGPVSNGANCGGKGGRGAAGAHGAWEGRLDTPWRPRRPPTNQLNGQIE